MLGMSVATPMFADDTDSASPGSASSSMHQAGESMENAATNTGHAVKDAYHGTVTALTDTKITAKVKHALHEAELTERGDIDVVWSPESLRFMALPAQRRLQSGSRSADSLLESAK